MNSLVGIWKATAFYVFGGEFYDGPVAYLSL